MRRLTYKRATDKEVFTLLRVKVEDTMEGDGGRRGGWSKRVWVFADGE